MLIVCIVVDFLGWRVKFLLDPCCIVGSVVDVGSCWNYAGSFVWNEMSMVESRSGNLVCCFPLSVVFESW